MNRSVYLFPAYAGLNRAIRSPIGLGRPVPRVRGADIRDERRTSSFSQAEPAGPGARPAAFACTIAAEELQGRRILAGREGGSWRAA